MCVVHVDFFVSDRKFRVLAAATALRCERAILHFMGHTSVFEPGDMRLSLDLRGIDWLLFFEPLAEVLHLLLLKVQVGELNCGILLRFKPQWMASMSNDFLHEHKVETYKSLITISLEAFKYMALLNGGAAAGMLTTVDKAVQYTGLHAFEFAICAFVIGLACSAAALLLSWLTQFRLHNENVRRATGERHPYFMWASVTLISFSLFAFCTGALTAGMNISDKPTQPGCVNLTK
jgi:hypothetical protein